MKGNSTAVSLPSAAFRAFVAAILAAGLMIPTSLMTNRAYADESTNAYSHGDIAISSDAATDNVIELEVGDTATITVTPYQHVQSKGCGRAECPEICEDVAPGACFVQGIGCVCDGRDPVLRTAEVTSTVADASIVSAGDIAAVSQLAASEDTLGDTVNGAITLTALKAGETTVTVSAEGDAPSTDENGALQFWGNASQTYTVKVGQPGGDEPVNPDEPEQDAPAIEVDQQIQLRQSGDTGTARVSLEGATAEWASAVDGVSVKAVNGNDAGTETELSADQYAIDVENGRITFNRTEDKPVFSVAVGEGEPLEVTNRWGETITYPQSKQYEIAISAEGYDDVVGTATFFTGASDTFYVAVDENKNGTVDEGEVKRTYTAEEIDGMASFQNGSSQCGMTGFRTFSAVGVPVAELVSDAGVIVDENDTFKLDTTDQFGSTFTYDQLFGERYFLQAAYDDPEVAEVYSQVTSDADSGSDTALRRVLAEKALEDDTTAAPMISDNYAETMLSGDNVGKTEVPTEENTHINSLVGEENQYRFTYGIALVQEDVTLTFNTGGGSYVAPQTVKSHLMTSTENTTIRSTYWNNGIIITPDAAEPTEPSTAAETLVVPDEPTRVGYTFGGWYTDEACTDGNEFDFEANDGTIDEDTTIYAKWVEDELMDEPQSEHPYANGTDQTYEYTLEGAGTYGMAVTFSSQTAVENGWDYLYVYDGDDNLLGTYTGTELAGKTIYVPKSDTVKIRLESDSSGNAWGFGLVGVEALTANDLGLVGSIAPISAQQLVDGKAEPAPVVTYGTEILAEDKDYAVSYENNTEAGKATVTVTGMGDYVGSLSTEFDVYEGENYVDSGAAISEGQLRQLRQSGDTGSTYLAIDGATQAWANAIDGVSVKSLGGNDKDAATELAADQYSVSIEDGEISFVRTSDAPVFSVAPGEGEPIDVTSWGSTHTYSQSKQYEVTISAEGYQDVVGTATFYTGASDTFSIMYDTDGDMSTADDRQVVKTWTQEELEAMEGYGFHNGSSQCGMTGFRTFSGYGVSLEDLLADAGVAVSEDDGFLIETTDQYGNEFDYDTLFGVDRFFLQAAYDDPEIKAIYDTVTSDADAGSMTELRRALAEKALADGTTNEPMISNAYAETMLSGDNVGESAVPAADNTEIDSLVNQENQYRFFYGIKIEQEDATVTFDTGVEGLEVPAQTVKTHLMTSTENTTMWSSYWVNSFVIGKGYNADAAEDPGLQGADRLTVPEAPVRDGYTFAGWYTKDGSADGDWGEEFDFAANDGTVDEDTTLYAKWVEGKIATGATVSAYREAQYGEPPAGDESDAGQHVQAVISFDSPVTVTDQEALLESLAFNINGSAASDVTAKAEGNTLVLDAVLPFALMGGQVNISANAEDGALDGITVAGEASRLNFSIATYADTGLAFEVVEAIRGTSTTPASTTFKVTHSANVRSMNHVVWLTNEGAEATGSNILGGAEWTAAHHHTFYNFTLDDSAESIVSNAMNPEGTNLADYGYTVTQGENGTFTITANEPLAGEVLSAAVYTDSFFRGTGLAMGEDVTGVAMPEASYPAVDLGMTFPEDAEYVSTSMGRDQAGKVDFSLTPSDDAVKAWQEYYGESATAQDLLTAWIESITSVSIDGIALEQKAFADYVDQLTDAVSDQGKFNYYDLSAGSSRATLTLPIALFDTTENETDTKTVTIESTGFGAVTGDVTYRNLGSDSLVIRTVDSDGNVLSSTVLTMDQLNALDVQEHYNTSANCGMAGLRTYNSEGVLLTDVLAAAGVEFGEGDVLHVRVNDGLPQNGDENTVETGYWNQSTFTYEELMGVDRYYYPDAWDTTPREELGGQSIYDLLSADKSAWKGDDEQAVVLAQLLGKNKQAVEPLIAWSWNEGVAIWTDQDPADATGYNGYTDQEKFRFLFGMQAAADGSIADDNTTFSNTYGVFGIDVEVNAAPEPTPNEYSITYNLDGGVNSPNNPATYTAGEELTFEPATKDGFTFDGWFYDPSFTAKATGITATTYGDIVVYAKWVADEQIVTPDPGQPGQGDQTIKPVDQNKGGQNGTQVLSQTGDPLAPIAVGVVAAAALLAVLAVIAHRKMSDRSNR